MKAIVALVVALFSGIAYGAAEKQVPLVQDQNKEYVTLFLPSDWRSHSDYVAVHNAIKRDKDVTQTHFNVYTPNDVLFQARYKDVKVPSLILQDPSGRVMDRFEGKQFPKSASAVRDVLRPWRENRPCPFKPEPKPGPEPGPEPVIDDEVFIDEDEAPEGLSLWSLLLWGTGGVAAGVGVKWYKEVKAA